MKKQKLLEIIDNELIDKLYGFSYARTNDSYEAQDLCSDIVFAMVKTARTEGEIHDVYAFIWRMARNVYADFCKKRKNESELYCEDDPENILPFIAAAEETEDDTQEILKSVYYRIAFLTKAYREVMIAYYIEGMSAAEIAKVQNTSETAIRQRLFSARKKVKSEVNEMSEMNNKPVALKNINYVIWGTGNPGWGDPRTVCTRQFSKHIVWLCRKKPMSAIEIARELNVPTVYVEEELEILTRGENGEYGLLRKLESGKYAINFILFDKEIIEKANELYTEQLPNICSIISEYIEKHKDEYIAFPYLNKNVDFNLILWQQVFTMSRAFSANVERILKEKYFARMEKIDRPFSVFGYVDNGKYYGGGWDGVDAENVCGYTKIHLDNIYITRIKKHFSCGLNVANDLLIQLALRAIDGIDANSLSEIEKEHAAKALECGYLYREGEMLYTKILVSDIKDSDRLYSLSAKLNEGFFEKEAETVASNMSELIHKVVPEYLLGEWYLANTLANMPVLDDLVEVLVEKGVLIPPEDGIGAEGCWMSVGK